MKSILVIMVAFCSALAVPCSAQSPDSSGTSPDAKASTPATGQQPASTDAKKKPKKVWTNEEIGSVKGGVSIVGDGSSSATKSPDKKSASASVTAELREKQIENYRSRIQELQGQIDAADKRISQLKNFKGENTSPSGGININQGYDMVPVEDQVRQLEDKKKQLQAKIDDVENDARKNGINSGELR